MSSSSPSVKPQAHAVITQARRNARIQDDFSRGGFEFIAVKDHILPSQCIPSECKNENNETLCMPCTFSQLKLPEIPEMVFPQNKLRIVFENSADSYIEFNAYDALAQVIYDRLPDVQVAPSAVWQSTRKGMGGDHAHPFDWTFTTDYNGTLNNCSVEETSETISLEKLKQQDEIGFYSQVTLYEDELADHGCAELSVRVRVMPNFFFALMRFYLRIDHVLIRVCDTRLIGHNNSNYILREWSRREAKVEDLQHLSAEVLLDSNRVWMSLPVIRSQMDKITPNK